MKLIPAIDIAGGCAVHARGGTRETYQPLQSRLCQSSKPLDVATGLLDLHPFTHLYIADLDAIQGRPVQSTTLRQLHRGLPPATKLWVDAGIRNAEQIQSLRQLIPATPVLGSETLSDTRLLEQLPAHDAVILSLDFKGQSFLGPPALLATPTLWPAHVIAMSLSHVGKQQGPDLQLVRRLHAAAPATTLYAAAGVRNPDDLRALRAAGCAGVLLASALHTGRLTAAQLADYSQADTPGSGYR